MRTVPSATELLSDHLARALESPNSWRMPITLVSSSPASSAAVSRSHQRGAVASSWRIRAYTPR